MRRILFIAFIVVIQICFVHASQASWLIDAEDFHASVHGQLSCQDCHSNIVEKESHPDPENVTKSVSEFFSVGQCISCHEDVIDEIDDGQHAGKEAAAWQSFNNCIECHNPHTQLSANGDVTPQDLDRSPAEKCGLCHDFQTELPESSTEDQACLQCHQKSLPDHPEAVKKTADLCFRCHHAAQPGKTDQTTAGQPVIRAADYAATTHAEVSCLTCHPQAAAFDHADQVMGDCGQCHERHDEKMIHDAHAVVSCGACHLEGITPQTDRQSGRVLWQRETGPGGLSTIHRMPALEKDASCRRCHFSGNTIGAAAMVLPAKSVMCMPCHTATFSVGDTTTILSLIFFVLGFLGVGSIWFSGGHVDDGGGSAFNRMMGALLKALFSARLVSIVKAFVLDGLLQRRLFTASRERWLLHALVFYPFIFRFVWGMIALVGSLWQPGSSVIQSMIDKNHPLTAFLFDLSGMMVIAGVLVMIIRRVQGRSQNRRPSDLPSADWPAYSLMGGIIIVGFVLEGMRMTMTGSPDGAAWAFMGDLVSRFLLGYDLTGIYGYFWYLHAILTGLFVVYLPFSRMLHMIMAPVVLAMNAASNHKR